MSNEHLFSDEMEGVARIKQQHVTLKKNEGETPGKKIRRRSAVAQNLSVDPLSSVEVPSLKSNDILSYCREGIQQGVFKKFRMGRYEIEACLDLHRLTVVESRREIFNFLSECFHYQLRTVIILHGKGDRNPEKVATLKSHLSVWLPQIDEVMAFHSALKQHGGTGAVYVMLKKSAQAKQVNRELLGL